MKVQWLQLPSTTNYKNFISKAEQSFQKVDFQKKKDFECSFRSKMCKTISFETLIFKKSVVFIPSVFFPIMQIVTPMTGTQ